MAQRIAGNLKQAEWLALTPEQRVEFRAAADLMIELGGDFGKAQKAEATEKRGFVYIISHPSWPAYVKIGRAFDPESRVRGYQTGCPARAYVLNFAVYFRDCHKAEGLIHDWLTDYRAEGEWFRLLPQVAEQVIYDLREKNYVG